MNTDPITGLREAVTTDGILRAELLAAASFEQAAAIAESKGWTVSAADIAQLARELAPADDELSDAELEQVSGGVSNVLKTRHDTAKNSISNIR